MSGGVGVLLSSAMSNFPHDTPFSFLASLSSHPHTAHSVTHYLLNLHTLTLELDPQQVTYDEDGVVLTQSINVFSEGGAVCGCGLTSRLFNVRSSDCRGSADGRGTFASPGRDKGNPRTYRSKVRGGVLACGLLGCESVLLPHSFFAVLSWCGCG